MAASSRSRIESEARRLYENQDLEGEERYTLEEIIRITEEVEWCRAREAEDRLRRRPPVAKDDSVVPL